MGGGSPLLPRVKSGRRVGRWAEATGAGEFPGQQVRAGSDCDVALPASLATPPTPQPARPSPAPPFPQFPAPPDICISGCGGPEGLFS